MDIASLAIIPSDGGRFEVRVNDALIFSKKQAGRHAQTDEITGLIRTWIEK
ncbi:MAG: hypothetical protein HFACDABA_01446 [Anaerolineales bacterium]|nr:hypothetical protein [Anaerolineales bacterium]